MKKSDPLAELARTVSAMRRLGVVKYGDVELGPEPADAALCVHKVPKPGHCDLCARDAAAAPRPNLPRFKRPS